MERTCAEHPPANRGLADWAEDVRRFLLGRLGDQRLAADLAQEAARRLLEQRRRGVAIHAPRAWMFRTARNLAVDEVRRRTPSPLGLEWQQRLVDPRTSGEDEGSYLVDGAPVRRRELEAVLPDALEALPARDRGYLESIYLLGRDCESLAREDRITVDAARVRLHRARRRLKQQLEVRARGL